MVSNSRGGWAGEARGTIAGPTSARTTGRHSESSGFVCTTRDSESESLHVGQNTRTCRARGLRGGLLSGAAGAANFAEHEDTAGRSIHTGPPRHLRSSGHLEGRLGTSRQPPP